jgi:hypothetical protein
MTATPCSAPLLEGGTQAQVRIVQLGADRRFGASLPAPVLFHSSQRGLNTPLLFGQIVA